MSQPKTVDQSLALHKTECEAALSAFRRDLQKVRTGRASAGLLSGINVDYYGSKVPLKQVGQISTPDAKSITIQVFDASAAPAVEKAIQQADLGLNPSRDGNLIRINVPPLTQERRKEIVRHVHKMAEDMRVSIRNHRRDANDVIKALEKDSTITKDDAKRGMDRVQEITNSSIKDIDELLAAKEAECMEV